MAKKSSERSSVSSDASTALSAGQSSVSETPYQMRIWRGRTQYVCPLCGADTMDRLVMLRHLVNKHDSELALVELVKLEGSPTPSFDYGGEHASAQDGKTGDVFEVELVETDSIVDAQGNERKKFTIKEN